MIINYLWVYIDKGTLGKHLENTHVTSSGRVPSRLFRSCGAGFLCELHSGSSSNPVVLHSVWMTNGGELATAVVLMQCFCVKGSYLELIGLDLDWKFCHNSAFSHRETGSWIWVSRFRFWYACRYSPSGYVFEYGWSGFTFTNLSCFIPTLFKCSA